MLKLYNTLTRRKEIFKPLKKKTVGLYTCGPTVYNYAHIGNLRTYLFEDILERTLLRNGYRIKRVMNTTDVGHLTSDADTGEDKMEKGAAREGRTVWDIARFYTKAFFRDIKELNIRKPRHVAPATKFIKEQVALIKRLFKRRYAYETSKAVYFDVSKFKRYTNLSRQKLSGKIAGAREEVIADPEKRNPQDFALWFKLVGRFKNHIMRWPSPWGVGFPGWHIECSAISSALLGQPFDIHTGGVDHIPLHHTNEIAQSEAAYGKPLARFWLHGEFLAIDTKRMGKSEENFITLETVKRKGFPPLAYRYFVLGTHYRKKLNFTWEALGAARRALEKLYGAVETIRGQAAKGNQRKSAFNYQRPSVNRKISGHQLIEKSAFISAQNKFNAALDNDLNTPQALAVLWETVNDTRLSPRAKLPLLLSYDKVLGLGLKTAKKQAAVPASILKLVRARELCRTNKQFTHADALRVKIEGLGYRVEDTSSGPKVLKKR
ncbi:cysteine--tRNA ligase [Candidatus Jorgensenbacteria bacterium CG10_big_fil_rev_8_21_14_0_10_54_38]|uniref:Cysteine--tRNA ligase n=2 Tax=Candidatus Joergenseniibacteriota TaxID=1752739 RepID=A0A2M6WFT3_9BACT|nr:MAG: cysteine--tRNA ligase [Candidatus Jorgensenbacteria bacterium CG23_combo_of_CG06-09_8_20_14_all_54_14]PIT91660.1 MAG: cysteine--tRNA ligase [Candidatus Jorgensenbacteria bacterium CG10_big_fil_rev_8_21_14_0_10_54_38]